MQKITVTDKIGDDYKQWENGDKVFVSAPTGTGKTYFVLNVLLPYVQQQNKRILFLVNRSILKKQIETDIGKLPIEYAKAIKVELYQTIENYMRELRYDFMWQPGWDTTFHPIGYAGVNAFCNYDYIVCDECHYFLADSNFNTNTGLSYRFVQDIYSDKVRIFLSATIENIMKQINEDDNKNVYASTQIYKIQSENIIGRKYFSQRDYSPYTIERNYDYLDIEFLRTKTEIIDIVLGNSNKWLIFVDNIDYGKKLKKNIRDKIKENIGNYIDGEVEMISSGYESDDESMNEVDSIVRSNKQKARILIVTSVMDNGINLKDLLLRNIIIMADTEVEFIQMLGRKREDGQRMKLYAYNYNRNHFVKRLTRLIKLKKIGLKYFSAIENGLKQRIAQYNGLVNWNEVNGKEMEYIVKKNRQMMQYLADKIYSYEKISNLFNVYDGVFYLNLLAFQNIDNLCQYYKRMIDKFDDEGEDAFEKELLHWLGKSEEEVEGIIYESKISTEERSRNNVVQILSQYVDQEMSAEENQKLKEQIRNDLLVLAQQADKSCTERKSVEDALNKNDRSISKENFNFFNKFCGIPYVMEKPSGSTFVIKKVFEDDTVDENS